MNFNYPDNKEFYQRRYEDAVYKNDGNYFNSKKKKNMKYNQKFQKNQGHQGKPAYNFSLYFKETMLEDPWKNLRSLKTNLENK